MSVTQICSNNNSFQTDTPDTPISNGLKSRQEKFSLPLVLQRYRTMADGVATKCQIILIVNVSAKVHHHFRCSCSCTHSSILFLLFFLSFTAGSTSCKNPLQTTRLMVANSRHKRRKPSRPKKKFSKPGIKQLSGLPVLKALTALPTFSTVTVANCIPKNDKQTINSSPAEIADAYRYLFSGWPAVRFQYLIEKKYPSFTRGERHHEIND